MTGFIKVNDSLMAERLALPRDEPIRLLIDTDAANEIDDQFAIALALLAPERMVVEQMTAAPFSFAHLQPGLLAAQRAIDADTAQSANIPAAMQNWVRRLQRQGRRANELDFVGPAQGMELSYQEILTVYAKLGIDSAGKVARGATTYMQAADQPVMSDAVEAIIATALAQDTPLYIAALGCVTNVVSALVRAPEIASRIVVIWTSAYPSSAPQCNSPSLNLVQDAIASRLIFDCGVPLIYLPGYQVGAQLKISLPEIEKFVKGRGAMGDYLWHLYLHNPLYDLFALEDTVRRTWVIWDIITMAWLINPDWVPTYVTRAPILDENMYWQHRSTRHQMREGYDVQRDEIFINLYNKLAAAS